LNSELIRAEKALERGDYLECIRFLEPLIEKYSLSEYKGAKIGMILVTAYIGHGDNGKATSTCRELTKCQDKEIKQKAKELLPILQAPTLKRPENWSIKIPTINSYSKKSNALYVLNNNQEKKLSKRYYPPTGSMKSLEKGYFILVLLVISILLFFLR
tara:strand:+ start:637 stop:1110 length:474 start_codon:yes stop_codon:yes gene_type:complete